MKTLATHNNPHLDDICAMWLLERFHPDFRASRYKFVVANPEKIGKTLPQGPGLTYVGVGRGQFDEHKGDIHECATTLVWKFLKKQKNVRISALEREALEELTAYVLGDDHARFADQPLAEFMPSVALAYLPDSKGKNSEDAVRFGYEYLDAIFAGLKEKQLLNRDWSKRLRFISRWGRGVAVETTVAASVVGRRALLDGNVLYIIHDTKTRYRSMRARAMSRVDFSRAYTIVKEREAKAEWYLHHSKKMLICGSDVAANMYLSKLSLKDLVEIIKKA